MGIEVIEGRDFAPADFAIREVERGPAEEIAEQIRYVIVHHAPGARVQTSCSRAAS